MYLFFVFFFLSFVIHLSEKVELLLIHLYDVVIPKDLFMSILYD